ncbi:hypothetical protein [Rhizobium sullae]|uniref:Uncharacterized protein n=1 Tax=Rhizobium sullae TaxID=50338 RepID=A0A4V6P0P0_RHISU|nr:hypothetical protein [Rhizobium sullae]TCU10037.1 hypothetical protein EV132_12228 [Rhizobium sullae]
MLIREQMPGAMPLASGKRVALCILIAVLAANFSVNAESRPSSSVLTAKLRMVCGRSDVVWNYIVSTMGEKNAIVNHSNRGRQGETIRHFLLYRDNSWVLIYDFFRRGRPSEEDQACIVASGTQETAYEATSLLVYELPEEWMGARIKDVPPPQLDGVTH